MQPIRHTVDGTEDDKSFTVNAVIADADNSTANTSFTVTIDDDTPVAGNLTGATFAEGSGVHDIGAAASLLGIVPGADGLEGTLQDIVFTNGGATGGTLSINGAGRLIYTSPTNVTSGTTVTETFTYTVTDRDGDSVTRTVTFGVNDTGITNPAATSASIDEDDIGVTGNAGGPDDLTTPVPTGTISYTKGADAITGITLSTGALGFTKLDGTSITTSYDAATGVLTGFGTGPADVVFTVTLGALGQTSTGYTVTLLQPIRHTVDGTEDDKSFTVNAVIADADNSTANTSFTVTIDDDTPVLADVIGGGSVVLDETGGFDTVTSTTSAVGFTANFGADGAAASGATIYTIERTSGGGATALKTVVGDFAISLVQTAPNVIKGQYNDGMVKDAFIVTINTDGKITVQQLVALEHNVDGSDAASYDDPLTLDGLITARVQITDRDGDSTSATTQIGDQITFRDDGLSAAPDTKSVAEGAVVNGNVLTDNPDTFGTDGPDATTPAGGVVGVKAGSDVSVPVTTGTGTVIETSLGFLTLNANGTYTYDSKGNTVGAAAVTDTFVYTIRDADGDTSTTTLTITINPVTLAGADQTVIVNEAALDLVQDPADLAAGTVTGSQPALGTETVTGTLTTTGATGAVTYTPQIVSDALGNFVLNADGTYKYTLKAAFDGPTLDNGIVTHPAVRTFNYTVTDASGNTDTGTITINVIDDVPTARADTDSVTEESAQVATGNVIDGVGTTNSPASIDTAGADGAAVTGVAFGNVAGPVAGSVGSLIDTPLGSLTLLSGGGYTYTLDNTNPTVQALGATEFLTETFTYTITDGDGDTSTTTLTIRINGTNDAPTITAASNAVSEEGLPGGIADTIGTSPSADTTNSKTATGTVVVSDIDGDALSVTFGTPATALTSGGVAITWALSDGGKTLTGSAGATPVIVATITNGGVYNVELTASIDHPDNIGTDPATFEDALNLVIPVSVSDGTTTVTNANGLTISIEDDSPVPVSAASSSLINAAGQSTTASLDTVNNLVGDNFGGDGAGKIIFTDATVAALQGQGLTSGSAALTYVISNGGQTITAEKPDGTDVFIITLQPAGSPNSYTVQMFQKLDSFEDVTFDASQVDVVGGNGGWAGYVPSGQGTGPGDAPVNDNSLDLLVTPMVNDVSTSTINTNANEIGVGGNFVDLNEGVRVDFVVDLTGTPVSGGAGNYSANPGNRAHTFDQHYDVNGASALFTAINTASTVTIIARDDNNTSPGGNDTNDLVGDGTIDNITKVAISYNGASLLITEAMWIADADKVFNVGGQNFTVAFGVNDATVSGVVSNTRIAAFTDSNYSSIEFKNTGGDDFKIGLFSASRIVQEPVPFTAPISITDRDGDTVASGSLSIIATPSTPPVVLDLDGDGAEFLSLAAGVHYDYAGDGAAEATAWVGSDDGILAYDANGNGRVDGGAEFVFGSERVSDLEGVAARFDENGDGILNTADGAYGLFGVWQDANSDGIADEGEFLTLSQAGIASITLTTNDQASSAANGSVRVQGTGTFTRADGSTGSVADAAFATKAKDSQRTAELVTTAAVAGAIAQAAPLAAQPALAENHATLRPEAAEITRVAEREASNSDSRSNEVTIDRTDRDASAEPTQADAHIRGETAEARIVTDDPDFDQDGPAADYLAAADGQAGGAVGNASLFASMGTEGLMDGLLTMGQPQFAHGQLPEGAFALAGNVLGDFAGEAMIDGFLDHFAPMGQGTVFAMTSLDGMADLLSHDLGGVGGFAMMAMPEANDDASMLAAAQA